MAGGHDAILPILITPTYESERVCRVSIGNSSSGAEVNQRKMSSSSLLASNASGISSPWHSAYSLACLRVKMNFLSMNSLWLRFRMEFINTLCTDVFSEVNSLISSNWSSPVSQTFRSPVKASNTCYGSLASRNRCSIFMIGKF